MPSQDGKNFSNEIDDRLSELFEGAPPSDRSRDGASGGSSASSDNRASGDSQFLPFTDLKAIILSIEWEISDETMSRLIDETARLQDIHEGHPVLLSFLKLLGSVGRYINNKKANAHPDSITLLHSIYGRLETILTSAILTEAEIKKMLSDEVRKFKLLKARLIALKGQAVESGKKAPPTGKPFFKEVDATSDTIADGESIPDSSSATEKETSDSHPVIARDDLRREIADLKKWLEVEFGQLRNDIRSLRGRP